jgi:thioredoxin 1
MAVRILCFYQPGCMGCREQEPINREVEKVLRLPIEEIDAVENPPYINDYQLKVTPTSCFYRMALSASGLRGSSIGNS